MISNIYVNDVFVDETKGLANFVVWLDVVNTATVTVYYNTAAGTAASNTDYQQFSSTLLTFSPGEKTKIVSIPITNDGSIELTEYFLLNLTSPNANAGIADSSAFATIVDNDASPGTPVVTINDYTIDEQTQEVTFVVMLDKPSNSVVSMNYATQNGTASAGSDLVAASGLLSFSPGETTKTIKVNLINDNIAEAAEAFNLTLSNLTNATTLDPNGTAIIFENYTNLDRASNSNLFVDDIFVDESQTYADFLVRLNAPNTNQITVFGYTSAGTAYGTIDYQHFSSILITFAPGEMVKTVRVPLLNDTTAELSENFFLKLTAPSANAVITDSSGTATIIDDDSSTTSLIASPPIVINGTNGNDILRGTLSIDQLNGGTGNDMLIGASANDSLIGNTGDDTYFIQDDGDSYSELAGEGTDLVISYLNSHSLGANVENLLLLGNAVTGTGNGEANIITGNEKNNTIKGGVGIDTLIGGLGNDNYLVGNGDVITENLSEGIDKVSSSVTYILPNNVENLILTGSNSINGTGNSLANNITGNSGNNVIIGNNGNDPLDGKGGADTLTGGAGKDKFKFTTAGATDTVTDFVVVDDTIQLENAVYTALTVTGTLPVGQFVIGAAALDANDYIIYNNATGTLLYDADGNGIGTSTQIATLSAGLAMTNADIVVI